MDPDDVRLAHELATVAAAVALPYFRNNVVVETKADGSPVSAADLAVERALIDMVKAQRPDDGILTEESGVVREAPRRRWIFDPIDGTSFFIEGDSIWGTHVALEEDGEIVIAIIGRPARGHRYWAVKGEGAYRSGDADPTATSERLMLSTIDTMHDARLGFFSAPGSTIPSRMAKDVCETHEGGDLIAELLSGELDAVVCGPDCGYAWDHAPCVLLTIEAGGQFTDPEGGMRIDLRGGVYSNIALHAQVRETFRNVS